MIHNNPLNKKKKTFQCAVIGKFSTGGNDVKGVSIQCSEKVFTPFLSSFKCVY